MVAAFLVARQALCIAGNLTINELLNLHKYQYMKRDDGTMYNKFDRGPVANCLQFWRPAAGDWDHIFHEERLVGLSCPVSVLMTTNFLYISRTPSAFLGPPSYPCFINALQLQPRHP